jgi:para-aminobenzoate synthetase component 1
MNASTPPPIPDIPRLSARLTAREANDPGIEGSFTDTSFAEWAHHESEDMPHVIFLSGGDHPCSVRSIAALRPALIFTVKDSRCRLQTSRGTTEFEADPFQALDELLEHWWCDADGAPVPLIAGYVAYEAGRAIETLPGSVTDTLQLPDVWMCFPTMMLIHNREEGRATACDIQWSDDIGVLDPLSPDTFHSDREDRVMSRSPVTLERSFDRASYLQAVERVRAHIYEGDAYQVNLSQRFRFPLRESPFVLWMKLFAENPAPFFAWIEAGTHQVLSTSMERFFLVEGERIETRPIKGTRPHGADKDETNRLGNELLHSAKDDAELSMIVDLERNDLGKVCAAGSVRVRAHKLIERYANVQHLVSIVEGLLLPGMSIGDIFRALFPGGSITGCPKIRAMEIIDAIEQETRHVYTGSIGYIAADGRADFNIAIRTAIVRNGICHLSVGGGIVYDSDPLEEYLETLHKGSTFFQIADIHTELD